MGYAQLPSDTPVSTADLPPVADVYQWALEQAAHIRAGRFDLIDVLNVADEIEAVSHSEYKSLVSNLSIILHHILKWEHQADRRSRSWEQSIDEHRERVKSDLEDSPSLKARWSEAVSSAYRYARMRASGETDLDIKTFPADCAYSEDDILRKPFPFKD